MYHTVFIKLISKNVFKKNFCFYKIVHFMKVEEDKEGEEEDDELGGLFKVLKKKDEKNNPNISANMTDSSKCVPDKLQSWELEEVGQKVKKKRSIAFTLRKKVFKSCIFKKVFL